MSAGGREVQENITELLVAHREGDKGAFDRLVPAVYRELRRIARGQLRSERPGQTLDATALVNEAYVKLVGESRVDWQNRSHFFAIAARTMRRILIDHLRRRKAQKRGGGVAPLELDPERLAIDEQADVLLALDRALVSLSAINDRLTQVVEYRFFAGMSEQETAEVLGVSVRTVRRDWVQAKAWLLEELG